MWHHPVEYREERQDDGRGQGYGGLEGAYMYTNT